MAGTAAADTDRRWVLRLMNEEKSAAVALIIAGVAGLLVAARLGPTATASLLHPVIAGRRLDLVWFSADGLLVVFFYVAGLELRHEITQGSLTSARDAAAPVIAAVLGMAVPALLFRLLDDGRASAAWGVPMATDLPLALALVALAGRGLPLAFRAFILSLAIVDDALSVLVIAAAFGSEFSLLWSVVSAGLVALYAVVQPRSGGLAMAAALAAWMATLQTGIHPTVVGVALGLATSSAPDRVRATWQPFAGFVAVPLFVATALAVPFTLHDVDGAAIGAVAIARAVGKPMGIGFGALLAVRLFRSARRLSAREYFAAGAVASVGFSVSMLFAELSLPGQLLATVKVAILGALVVCSMVGILALTWLRASSSE